MRLNVISHMYIVGGKVCLSTMLKKACVKSKMIRAEVERGASWLTGAKTMLDKLKQREAKRKLTS